MTITEALQYYADRYDCVGQWSIRPDGQKIYLGNKEDKYCRFCLQSGDAVTFRKKAHAIPEALGNKSLFSYYECDACNEHFGQTIETDFGGWSKPMRTLCRINGKNGVPSIRLTSDGVARIDVRGRVVSVKDYEHDPSFDLDETAKTITFSLKRDSYTPVAVIKAFVKFGLTLMPATKMAEFDMAREWIRNPDHAEDFVSELPLLYTFISGPMPNDVISLKAFIRKDGIDDVPYAFFVLTYANEIFQVYLPCPLQDKSIHEAKLNFPAFPNDVQLGVAPKYRFGTKNLNMMNRERVVGEVHTVTVGYDRMESRCGKDR